MATKIVENERTAMAQKVTRQPDGPGKCIGKKGEISGIGKVAPGEQNCSAIAYRRFRPRRDIGRGVESALCMTSA